MMIPYGLRRSWHDSVREGGSIQTGVGPHRGMPSQSPIGCRFRRTLGSGARLYDQNTRKRWNRCFRGSCHYCQPESWDGLQGARKRTFKSSFTYSSEPSTAELNSLPPSLAKCLNPAPGNQSGTYLTLGPNRRHSPGSRGLGD